MKRIFRALSMAATIVGLSISNAHAQETMRVGDLPASSPSSTAESAGTRSIGDNLYAVEPVVYGDQFVRPAGHHAPSRRLRSSAGYDVCSDCYSGSCNGNCPAPPRKRMAAVLAGDDDNNAWLRAELLLWFPQTRTSPILAATNPLPGGVPAVGQPGFQPQFGGDIGGDMEVGFRADVGKYFADGQLGLGARLWFLSDAKEGYSATSDGTVSLGVPFFDTQAGAEGGLLVGFNPNIAGGPVFNGTLTATTELDIAASELYARLLFVKGKDYRVDLIGGYSYFNIEDNLSLNVSTVRVANPADGLTRNFQDRFDTANNFHGGQIGFENLVTRGPFSIRTLTKVHLGNMSQRVAVRGSSQRFFLGNLDPQGNQIVENFNGGIFALDNQGVQRRDVFAFAPEANFKLNYRCRNYVNFSLGYSFIYWNHVALAGDQIDRNVDPAGLLTNAITVASPSRQFKDRGFFVQGLDLGVSVDY